VKLSYNWLKSYFDESLPEPEKLVEVITRSAYEVERLEKKNEDYTLDIDVLPNRAHDSLCHKGIAREISVLTERGLKEHAWGEITEDASISISVDVEEPTLCRRYIGKPIKGIKVGTSPEWLKERLETIGQKSINNIVDITNFVMFDIGQPMHAFDADKVEGRIVVRKARAGERITTLDGQEVDLDTDTLIIADEKDPLAIAGIKGGTKAVVDEKTTNIILEAANFHPAETRKASTRIGIKTDSSKRFENELSQGLAEEAMKEAVALITEGISVEGVGVSTDVYPKKEESVSIEINTDKVNKLLGSQMTDKDTEEVLDKLQFVYKKDVGMFNIEIPNVRLDLRIAQDLIEEIGRIYGYDRIEERVFAAREQTSVNKLFYYSHKIRNILREEGYSESYLYAIVNSGEVEVANPIASDKSFLRTNLASGIAEVLEYNSKNAPLLGLTQIKMFEIGNVFYKDRENVLLSIGVWSPKGEDINEVLKKTITILGYSIGVDVSEKFITKSDNVWEINLVELIETLPEPTSYENVLMVPTDSVQYKPISPYPFITRDIAVFVPSEVEQEAVETVIRDDAGELLVHGPDLFDRFEKKNNESGEIEKVSYAFNIVFQSNERTLTDEEINKIMVKITENLNAQDGWEVR